MKMGKLALQELNDIIKNYTGVKKDQTILSAGIGEDACLIDLKSIKDDVMLISSDPITFTSNDMGKLGIIINTNDIYASGGKCYGIMLTVLIPPDKSLEDFRILMEQIHNECLNHNIQILGGHTEVTDIVREIVISITTLGISKKNEIVKTSTSICGDLIFMTKTLGIEGSIILYDRFKCKTSCNYDEEIEKFKNSLSIKKEAEILRDFDVTSMHDITEGGLIGALLEMSYSSSNGFRIFEDKIRIHKLTKEICDTLNVDVLRLISSGSLVFTANTKFKDNILKSFEKNNICCSVIGEVISKGEYLINKNGVDEKVFEDISDSYFNGGN